MLHLYERNGRFYYRRRVPEEVAHLDRRKEVKISLKTMDRAEAMRKAMIYNDQMEEYWAALIKSGVAAGAEEKYAAAVRLAKAKGFVYKTAGDLNLNDIMERMRLPIESREMAEALLGGVEPPPFRLSRAIEHYPSWCVDRLVGKDERRKRKWTLPRTAAAENLISVVGDKPINEYTRQDFLRFFGWWRERIADGANGDTANKQLRFVKDILKTASTEKNIPMDVEALFKDLRFSFDAKSRPPFEAAYVRDTLLRKLDGMGDQARAVVWALAETGARPAEIIERKKGDIFLDAEIPFIWIRGHIKTRTSERQIPLAGYALEAFRQFPNGFDQWGNPDSCTNAINAYLRENKLLPTEDHSLYSLRHTFKDRLRDAECPDEIINELMGHKKAGPQYGRGHLLEKKAKWLNEIAYKKA